MFSLSEHTMRLVRERILPHLYELNCTAHTLKCGALVVDMGVHAPGGWEAARLFTLATLGGLGRVSYGSLSIGDRLLDSVEVRLDRPQEAALSAQFSAWKLKPSGPYQLPGFASGPARAIARRDGIARMWHYRDSHDETLLALQTAELPDESLVDEICAACSVKPDKVYLLAASTGSLVGCVQIAARMAEVSLWGLGYHGFPLECVLSFAGSGAIPPVCADELIAMDRVNSATFYGSTARYIVDCADEDVERIMPYMAYADTKYSGRTFAELYDEAERDIFKMDSEVHKVAFVELANRRTGRSFRAGALNADMLFKSYYDNVL